ncbi:conserved hypothetical protein [Catenulispora acidiphila DSM 44928]|uniref:Uncharacterized protein n=1 Tax=Catenulispora acidiphila (strain DSM 44928 / JCM 14897 / NBRC 102108 / NRRL B-24433 / ID139908) TaxID=479433 RepID=C7Q2I5_CATAD|nr:hypothetical protein [Catenulispora acidiphila]ACU69827.1 conserved hypothetical protein [Catenulispora acidiphila DSM 44928]
MATLRAVVEIGPEAVEGAAWPVEFADNYRWETLNASTTPETIGTVMAALAEWCRPEDAEPDATPTATEALHWIAEADYLVIRAGIQLTDTTTGTTVNPGCCADLEDWRAWPHTWLGHDPTACIEQAADGLLIHQEKTSQNPVKLPTGTLPALLADLREDLIAFLAAAQTWITTTTADPDLAAAVIATIDRHAAITAPLAD